MVTQLALSPRGLVTVRTNLVPNPMLRVDSSLWSFSGGAVRSTGLSLGPTSVSLARTASSVPIAQQTSGSYFPVTPGLPYAFSARGLVNAGTDLNLDIQWYTAAPALIGGSARAISNATVPARWGAVAVAPAGAALGRLRTYIDSGPANTSAAITGFMVEQATVLGEYFDGETPDAGGYTYDWTGTADGSPSVQQTTDPDTATAAILTVGYEVTRAVHTIVHEVPNAPLPPVTFKPAQLRSGTLQFLFAARETCRKAEIIHSRPGYITITDPDWPDGGMRYVAQGDVTTQLDPESRELWLLTTGFQEA